MFVKWRYICKQKKRSKENRIRLYRSLYFRVSTINACVILALSGCAKIAPPTGGPIDEVSPEVISFTPVNDALFVPKDMKIEIQFSEDMDRERTEDALFLSPYDKIEMQWKGKRLQLDVTLRTNTTYLLTIGTRAQDLRGNVLREPFQMAFSTGDRLDPGSLTGNVYRSDGRSSTAEIFVYDLAYFSDEVDFGEPKYRTQCLMGGRYNFSRLAPGIYRVIAFEDANRNGSPDPEEWLAIPSFDVEVQDTLSYASDLILTKREKPRIVLEKIVPSHSRSLILFLNNPIDLANFSIEIDGLYVNGFYLSEDKQKINVTTEEQRAGQIYNIKLLKNDGKNIRGEKVFHGNGNLDLTPPRLLSSNNKNIFSNSSLKLNFSEAMDNRLTTEMQLPYDEHREYLGVWRWHSPNQIYFVPAQPWPVGNHVLNVEPKGWRDRSGQSLSDSILIIDFKVFPTSGSISGEVIGHSQDCSVLLNSDLYSRKWEIQSEVRGRFSFLELPPGSYSVWTYIDENGDDNWNPGTLKPYVESERRVEFSDVINLDSGEHLDNILLEFSDEKKKRF
tara:strand:+ start:18274 stop:19950 length:1677 start_codon:yes stop_codon:yes gene_type:complete